MPAAPKPAARKSDHLQAVLLSAGCALGGWLFWFVVLLATRGLERTLATAPREALFGLPITFLFFYPTFLSTVVKRRAAGAKEAQRHG